MTPMSPLGSGARNVSPTALHAARPTTNARVLETLTSFLILRRRAGRTLHQTRIVPSMTALLRELLSAR